jgi:alpha-tubulin suppressor-like RCC1 family protein
MSRGLGISLIRKPLSTGGFALSVSLIGAAALNLSSCDSESSNGWRDGQSFGGGGSSDPPDEVDQHGSTWRTGACENTGTIKKLRSISVGYDFTCAVTDDGKVVCWGQNSNGQIGCHAYAECRGHDFGASAVLNDIEGTVISVVAGSKHACALLSNGSVVCWGSPQTVVGCGDTCRNGNWEEVLPTRVLGPEAEIVDIAAGFEHTCALQSNGNLMCWGENGGTLSVGDWYDRDTPTTVIGLKDKVRQVSAGGNRTCVVTDKGSIWCWGSAFPMTGGGSVSYLRPVLVEGFGSGVQMVSTVHTQMCAIIESGGVMCNGYNNEGVVGDGTTDVRVEPVPVQNLESGVVRISCGDHLTCAITENGATRCWGDAGKYGLAFQSGSGNSLIPAPIDALDAHVSSISIGSDHMCTVKDSGRADCWGVNRYNQLGQERMPNPDSSHVRCTPEN